MSLSTAISQKRIDRDKLRLDLLVSQLTNLKDVRKVNFFIDKHFKCEVVDDLQRKLTKSLPLMSMKHKSLNWSRYKRVDFYRGTKYFCKPREDRYLLNYASRNSLLIYVFSTSMFKKTDEFVHAYVQIFKRLALYGNTPKVLLVLIAPKPMNLYTDVLLAIHYRQLDCEMLEISCNNAVKRGAKRFRKANHHFMSHQLNIFTQHYNCQWLSKNVTWFEEKLNNLHKFQVGKKGFTQIVTRRDPVKKKNHKIRHCRGQVTSCILLGRVHELYLVIYD